MFLKLHTDLQVYSTPDLQAYTLQSTSVLLRRLTITMSKSINAVTIYLKLNTLNPRQIVESNVEFGLFLKVSCIYSCIKLYFYYQHCNFNINRMLIAMNLMLQTLKVPRKLFFWVINWNYLQRYLSIQDVLENCCFQAVAKKFGHCLIRGM